MSTIGDDYTQRLTSLESARWKQLLNVQAPYRWNLRRLNLGRTLDVGCGIGRVLSFLDDAVGVDHNVKSVETARQRGLRAYTTEEWPTCVAAVPASFDTLVLSHVLEHLSAHDADQVITEYLPYLKPSARLVMVCPQERGYASDATHMRFVDFVELEATARRHGFTPTLSRSFPLPRKAGRAFTYNEFVVTAAR